MFQPLLQGLKELFYPDNCLLCQQHINNQHRDQLCPSCYNAITLNTPPFCLKCSRHLNHYNDQGLCPLCLKLTPPYDIAYTACIYLDPLTELIHQFKYFDKTSLRKTFGKLLISYIDSYHIPLHDFDYMIPMPLHPTRQRERGYNQSSLLVKIISEQYQIPFDEHVLIRTINTPSQSTMESKQRFTNIKGAFKILNPSKVHEKNILIVDDVLTTGSTAAEASLTLKEAGSNYIGILTLATTP